MQFTILLSTVIVGAAVGAAAWAGASYWERLLAFAEADLRDKFRRLRMDTRRVRTWLVGWLAAAAVVFFVTWFLLGLVVLGLAVVALLICLPYFLLRRMAEQRRMMIEDQLADAMVSLSSAIKAGLSLGQSMEILAEQTPEPICQEFQQIVGEYQLGKPMEQCLRETKERLHSENFALFAAAIEASRESGGKLNETVDRIAHSVRELQRLERKVQTETAQARASAFYMALAPFVILLVYYFFVDPVNTSRLFTTLWGQIVLSAALVFDVVAYVWARKILSPEI